MRIERCEGTGKLGKTIKNIKEWFHFLQGLPTRTFTSLGRLQLIQLLGRNAEGGILKQVAVILDF